MAAILLSSMLLAAVTGLAARMSQVNAMLLADKPAELWLDDLERQLQTDFQNCRSIQFDRGRLLMAGYFVPTSSQLNDRDNGIGGHVPMQVAYEIVPGTSRAQLIRKETRLDRSPSDNRHSSLIALDVSSIDITQRLESDVAPGQITVELQTAASDRPVRFHLVRHGGTGD